MIDLSELQEAVDKALNDTIKAIGELRIAARREGRKEVADFIDSRVQFPWKNYKSFEEWQAKLREWEV